MTRPSSIPFLLVLAIVLPLGGCGAPVGDTAAPAATPSASPVPSPATQPSPAPAASPAEPTARAEPGVALDGEGLRFVDRDTGRTTPLAFGTARDVMLEALAFRGPPGSGTNSECGAGPLDYASWPDGLILHFQGGDFVGWAADGRGKGALTTMSGVGIGSTRADLDAAYAATVTETSLGQEFAAGALFGILSGPGNAATIENMWAGTSCNFR